MAACAVSLAIHKPLTDLNSFLDGRVYSGFSQRRGVDTQGATTYRSILVVDDSIYHGNSMRHVRNVVSSSGLCQQAIYAAAYGLSSSHDGADIVLEACPAPRAFEWNIMNHGALEFSCVDLDGVLCVDPTDEENDDGTNYMAFIRGAELLNCPKYRINSIVTSRLEKYRGATEEWLRTHNIAYEHLFMLELPSAEERRRLRIHAKFKARVFKERNDCLLFIESELGQAKEIRALSGKCVLAYKDMHFFPEAATAVIQKTLRQRVGRYLPNWSKTAIKAAMRMQ